MTTTAAKLATNDLPFSTWLADLITKFDCPEEYGYAAEIYSFAAAYENDLTAQQAYDDFDAWVSG